MRGSHHIETSAVPDVRERHELRARLSRDVDDFLGRGGRITVHQPGETGESSNASGIKNMELYRQRAYRKRINRGAKRDVK